MHEHYSLEMLSNYGIAVPQGELAYTPDQAKHIAVKLGTSCGCVCFPGYLMHARNIAYFVTKEGIFDGKRSSSMYLTVKLNNTVNSYNLRISLKPQIDFPIFIISYVTISPCVCVRVMEVGCLVGK